MDKEYTRMAMHCAVYHTCPWYCFIGMPMLYDGGLFVNREPFSHDWEYKLNRDSRIRQMQIINEEI